MEKQYVFVCGVGRSGTTALTRALAGHEKVVLGMERFKRLHRPGRLKTFTPERFSKDSFFDFSTNLTNITPDQGRQWRRYYREMEAKFESATHIGDKIADLSLDAMRRNFPEARFVFILRDVLAVAASWDARARRAEDTTWPAHRDARVAVGAWNAFLATLDSHLVRYPDRSHVVRYEELFGEPGGGRMRSLFAYLGLDATETAMARFSDLQSIYRERVAGKSRDLPADVTAFIRTHADIRRWEKMAPGRAAACPIS
jgi:hypothetical protein